MWGFEARDELALAVVCWFWPFLVMWWVCVCVWGLANVSGVLQSVQGLGIIDLFTTN